MAKEPAKARMPSRTLARLAWVAGIVLVGAVGVAVAWRSDTPITADGTATLPAVAAVGATTSPSAAPTGYVRRETRPTLDPAQFVGKARQAHQVAREIPDVLDQLYCYCECDKHFGHKGLLSCYTDGHAAT